MDRALYRTCNDGLRRQRYDLLIEAARRAAKAAKGSGFDLKVSGSLSRGETHPWSDLDLVLMRATPDAEKNFDLRYDIQRATRLDEDIDVMFEDEIIEPLRKGLIESAVAVDDIPPLGELPDPELALPRCAISLETALDYAQKTLDYEDKLAALREDDIKELMRSTGLSMARDRIAYRVELCLKRLAVFQDGGRSTWLDDREDGDLDGMLNRLATHATEPFERPAILTPEAAASIRWLLGESDRFPDDDKETIDALEADLKRAMGSLRNWIAHLRAISSLTETHGLAPQASLTR